MKSIIKLSVLTILLAFSCVKEKGEVLAPGTFEIDTDTYGSIYLEKDSQVFFVPVKTNIAESQWKFESSASWCKAGRSISSEKGIMISVESNEEKEEFRSAAVSISAEGKKYTLTVVQTGSGPVILVSNVSVGPEAGEVFVDVVTNVALDEEAVKKPRYAAGDEGGWLTFSSLSVPTKGLASTRFVFNVDVNTLPENRKAEIVFNARSSSDSKANTTCVITQNCMPVSAEAFSDNRVRPLGASANQDDASYSGGAQALIDGNYGTFYHSPSGEGNTKYPVVWEFEFSGEERIDYLSIMHRQDGSSSGHWRGQIGNLEISYKTDPDAAEYTPAGSFNFNGSGGYQSCIFDSPIEGAKVVRISILDGDPNSGQGKDGNYITAAEVEFYSSNRDEVNTWITKIFKDLSCSELRTDVDKDALKRLIIQMNGVEGGGSFIATNVAMPLLSDTYNKSEKLFRIHEYEPYSDNSLNQALVTRIYSAMNNPTGIEVKAGKDIVLCVDKIPAGQEVSLAVYGDAPSGELPNYGGGSETEGYDQNIPLKAGINNVRINANGMAYIMNVIPQADPRHPDKTPVSNYSPVKVHILPGCGTVQGYYDPSIHEESLYSELLNKCTYKYFTVKGKKCMFTFHTNQLRTDFRDGIKSGIEAWDDVVLWQHQLMGIDGYTWFNNHMMAVTSTNKKAYMDASHRRVLFATGTLAKIGSREALKANEGGWGPCHEMGHVNQQAINWKSTTESSNNLFSNYCIMKLAGDDFNYRIFSRGKTISDLAADYAQKRPWCLLGDGSYQGEDPELHMRMNWQLWNYYQNLGKKADFFPRLFSYLRENPLPSETAKEYKWSSEDPGLSQLEYYEAACIAAGEDLTEFFDAWGFFIPVEIASYKQYSVAKYQVTAKMIADSKARVAAMKLPKAAPIQYLEDRKVIDTDSGRKTYSEMGHLDVFKNNSKVGTPTAKVSGSDITLSGCEGAVAVELRRGTAESGELLYFSNLFKFTSPVNPSGHTLWAVQADGTRKKVTIGN